MPELPEAETIVRDLRARIAGARIVGVQVLRPDLLAAGMAPATFRRQLRGRRIAHVSRRAKKVVLELEGEWRLVIHLGMTGRVVVDDGADLRQFRHVGVRLALADGRALLYDDARRFGRLEVLDAARWRACDAALGVEPLSDAFTAARLHALSRGSSTPIRNWLLDQKRVAGIGNIYAVEALFRAGIRPTRRARTLTRRETAALRDALRALLGEAIAARGTTISDYRDGSGARGGFGDWLRAYGREGEPCGRCGARIRRVVLANRSACYCPHCQR